MFPAILCYLETLFELIYIEETFSGMISADFNASTNIVKSSKLEASGFHTKKFSSTSLCNNFFCSKPAAFKNSKAPSN
ncbi:hypothetical protein V1478_009953, partial [Vespula squamosa]